MLASHSRGPAHRVRVALPVRLAVAWAGLLSAGLSTTASERAGAQELVDAPESSENVQRLDAVVVTGSRTERTLGEAPVATEVISREQIEESGARDLAELLEDSPGVMINRSFAGAGPELEGLPADYTLILVDGVRVPGRISGVLDLSRFSTENIERIEIVRGAGSALYGSDAIAGVINVITRRATEPLELGGTLSAGPNGRLDVTGSAGVERGVGSLRVSGGRRASAGFDLDPSNVATTQGAFQQYDVAQNSELKISSGFRLDTSAEYLRRARQGIDQSGAGAVFDRDNLTQTVSVGLRPELELGAGMQLHLRTSYARFRDEFELDQRGSDALDDRQDTREHLGQLGAQLDALLGSHLLSAGAEGSYESLATERLANGTGDRTRLGVYAQDEWTLLEAPLLVLLPGARVDLDSQFGAAPTPRVALRFDPLREVTLRASYGWGFKAPDFRELYLLFENPSAGYLVQGNTELEPERSRNVGASAEFRPHRSVSFSLQGFYNLLEDRIDTGLVPATDMGPQRFRYRNVDSAVSRGLIASLSVSPLAGLKLDLSYDLTDARSRGSSEQRLSGQPAQRATASLRYRAPNVGFETSWRGSFVGTRPFYQDTDGDGVEEQRDAYGYASIDVRVAQRIGYGFRSFFLGENLLNAGDAEFLALAPRTFSGGVQFEY
jgi:outer membrane receptor for ferrienterochelin and colicins